MAKKDVSELKEQIRRALDQKPLRIHTFITNLSESASPDTLLKEVKKELKSQKSRINKALMRLLLARVHLRNVDFDSSATESLKVAQDDDLPPVFVPPTELELTDILQGSEA